MAINILNLHFSYYILHTVTCLIINAATRFNWLTLMMLGRVRYCLHVPWPPPSAVTPLFSMIICITLSAKIPAPAVRESPIAAMTSISPGLNLCTDSGTFDDRPSENYYQSSTQAHDVSHFCHLCNNNLINFESTILQWKHRRICTSYMLLAIEIKSHFLVKLILF